MTLKLTVIGNVTRDAEMRSTNSNDSVLNFSIARNDRRTKEVTYVDCSIWGKLAESLEQYLRKGTKVFVEGELGTREYQGKTYITCRVRDIELLGGRDDNAGGGNRGSNQNNRGGGGYPDDDIPF